MSFEEKSLDLTVEFGEGTENKFIMIQGTDKMVYWKGCNVTVYEKDSKGKEHTRKLVGMPDGQGWLPIGTELYITDGKVKQG